MNAKKIVTLSNIIGIISIFLLIYWIFIFVSIEVFGLKVFRENMTQTFYLSVLGILALMFGALILNIMFNLTRIAQKHNNDQEAPVKKRSKVMVIAFIASFPVIFALLFAGDLLTSIKKEKMLIKSAASIISNNNQKVSVLADYQFDKEWVEDTKNILNYMAKIDRNYRSVSVIVQDQIDGSQVFLEFGRRYYNLDKELNKTDFIFVSSLEEREYLKKVFSGKEKKELFSSYDGNYKLFYPYFIGDKVIVLYFSDRQSYGKIGS